MVAVAVVGAAVGAALGCGGGGAAQPPPSAPANAPRATLAEEEVYKPGYGKPELQQALIAERGLEATDERRIHELEDQPPSPAVDDQLRVATGDLAVRRRFIATLELCEAQGRLCPPRLDDPPWSFDPDPDHPAAPPMTASLRFDLASWRALAGELFGRACACRTIACVDSVGVAIDQLEARPTQEVRGDGEASAAVTHARECLARLRGKVRIPFVPRPGPPDAG